MKPRLHAAILFACALALPLLVTPVYSQSLTTLTEADIRAMLSQWDQAARKRNVAGIMAPVAKDVKLKIAITTPQSNGEQSGYITREQFEFNLRHNMSITRSYKVERKNIKIKVYDDNTAMVESELYETSITRVGTLRGSTSEVLFVGLKDGKIVVTSIDSRMRVY
jgi:hypothetical protein